MACAFKRTIHEVRFPSRASFADDMLKSATEAEPYKALGQC
jgi:hypothetical protein